LSTRFRGRFDLLAAGLLLLMLATAATASAQTSSTPASPTPQVPVTVGTAGGDVTIVADELEQIGPDNLLVATGNVELTKGTARLMADRIELNRATGDAVAQGRVVFYDGEDQLTAQRIEYNVKTGTGVVYQGQARGAPYYRLSGERMDRLGESVYGVKKGVFTTCEGDPPDWSFRFGSVTADLNEYIYGTDASFWVRNIPVIPFLPFFAAAIRRERQTGFLFPKFGYSTRKGAYAEFPFYWAINDSQDMTFSPLGYTNLGEGFNLEYRYILPDNQRGRFGGFFMQESAKHDASRFVGTTRQDWTLAPRTWLKVDATGVSDDHVLADYGDDLYQRSSQRVESNIFLTRSWDAWNLVGNLFWYQDLTTRRPVELNRLPDIRFVGATQPLHDLPGVLWNFEGSAVRFVRDVGSDGGRVDIHPQVLRPIPLEVATLTPFVGGRLTGYDRTVTGFHVSQGVTGPIENTNDDTRLRRLVEAGATLESKLSRVYQVGGARNVDALLHTVEPRVSYTWVAGKGKDRLPQWTPGLDSIQDTSLVEYSLTNRIRGRTIALANAEPTRWEMFRLTLGHSYDQRNDQWGDAFATVIAAPTPTTRLRSDLTYDPRAGDFPSVTADLSTEIPRGQLNVGIRYSDPAKITYLQGGFTLSPWAWLTTRGSVNWDLYTETFAENRFAAELHWQCWALAIEFINRTARDDEVRFTLNLLGVSGPISTRVGLGAIESGRTR
jgi:LPS-assembly protein